MGQNFDSVPGKQMDEKERKSACSCSAALDLSVSLFCPSLRHSNLGDISMSHQQLLQHLGKVPYLRVFMAWQLAAMESKEIFLQRECWQAALLWEQLHVDSDLYSALKINHKWKVENYVPFCAGRVWSTVGLFQPPLSPSSLPTSLPALAPDTFFIIIKKVWDAQGWLLCQIS